MRLRTSLLGLLAAPVLLAGSDAARAQSCTAAPELALAGGYASYRVADGTAGPAFGADAAFQAGSMGVRVRYRRVLLDGAAPDPDILRGSVTYPTVWVGDIMVCADLHAGVSRFELNADVGAVLAGGGGLTLTPAVSGPVRPWVSVRGLGGWATGTILGLEIDATALAAGVEAGVAARVGAVSLRVIAARDGFDDGLGVTPYPGDSYEITVGYHF
ncbi:MAG: hypothetical protein R6U63_01820 [Longimicrobiales bacterium]